LKKKEIITLYHNMEFSSFRMPNLYENFQQLWSAKAIKLIL